MSSESAVGCPQYAPLPTGALTGVHLRELLDRGGSKRLSTGQEVTVLTGGAVLVVAVDQEGQGHSTMIRAKVIQPP